MKLQYLSVLILAVLLGGCSRENPHSIDYVDFEILLSRMTNMNGFAEAPLGDSFLESSYDRSGGNNDWAVYTQADSNGRITVFNQDGPGYLSRFWIASFAAKKWFFYFDGESDPRLILTKADFFGGKFPFLPPLAGISGGGRYSLVPIPFSKSLRIEIEPSSLKSSNRNYYQLNYTKLDMPSDQVESFPKQLTSSQSNAVVAVNTFQLANRAQLESLIKFERSEKILPQEEVVFWQDAGDGLLKSFSLRIDDPIEANVMKKNLLRGLRLQMFWNGADQPSVDVPLGDFFCNPFYYRSFSSMPLGQVDGTFVCRFPMPYQKGARCVLKNTSGTPVTVSVGAHGDRESSGGLSRKFHAVWRAQNQSGTAFQMLETEGSGHYVGCFLSAIGQDGTWTILEGDEILRPDPEKQPAQFGTGLEDYFNGAYYYTSLFDLPLHGLIEKGAMRTDQYRLHLLETVPFEKSFAADIEFGDRNRAKGYMSSVMYWYADEVSDASLINMQTSLLKRPGDRFELPGLMAPFFLLERAGLYADAAARMNFFANRHGSQLWSDRLKVRALGYREKVEGFESVRAEYETFIKSPDPAVAKAAQDRLWLAEDPSHALLGISALGKYRLLQDGKPVAEGEGRNDLRVLRTSVSGGDHQWDVDLTPTKQGSYFSLCLRTQQGDITSAGEWNLVDLTPLPGRKPPESFKGNQVLPNMTIWAFEPNSYTDMQSSPVGVRLWSFWDSRPVVQRVRLKKNWTLDDAETAEAGENERSEDELKAHAIN